ncbi:MAG TPA: PKD domain-containing protein [Bacteroidia bacterium]|nr:PKD domain-containing protein [Bacteroidia bacterium]
MSPVSTIPLTDTVYDVVLGANYNIIYACGRGYVSSVTITPLPTVTITNSITNAGCGTCNGKATPTLLLCGNPPVATPSYLWSDGQTTQTAKGLCAGTYTVTISLGCGNNSYNDTVTINTSGTTGPLTVTPSQTNVKCYGDNTGMASIVPTTGTGPYSYTWSNAATTSSVNGLTAGTYSVVVTDATCLVDTSFFTITQPAALTIKAVAFPTACSACNGQVNVIPTGGTGPYGYYWNNGNTNASQSGLCAGTDSIYVTDANGCKHDTSVTVTQPPGLRDSIITVVNERCNGGNAGSLTVGVKGGTAPYTYLWTGGQTASTASALTAGSFTVTVTDKAGCGDSAVAVISQPALVVVTPSTPQTICIGQSATLSVTAVGGTPGYTYNWVPGLMTGNTVTVTPTTTTTYTISTVDNSGCSGAPVSITVTVNPPLSVTVSPNRATCPGGSVSFVATAAGGDGTYNYTWNPGGMTGSTITVVPASTTEYTVLVTDGCGSTAAIDSVKAIVNPLPAVNFKADTLQGCSPVCVKFTDQTTIASGSLLNWQWAFGDGSTSNTQNGNHCYNNAGAYGVMLVVKSDSGCIDSLTLSNYIAVYSHPVAAFSASPQPATIIDPTINFTDQSTDDYGIKNWLWQFGDPLDGTSTTQNPIYNYGDTGTFCQTLKVTNTHGCIDTIEHCIVIEPYFTLYIPNAFTPDANGLNDVFTAKGAYICDFKMYIFDRWGMQLYYTNNINKGWDGRVNDGKDIAQEDTYVYLIYAVDCVQHKQHEYLGKVSIIK